MKDTIRNNLTVSSTIKTKRRLQASVSQLKRECATYKSQLEDLRYKIDVGEVELRFLNEELKAKDKALNLESRAYLENALKTGNTPEGYRLMSSGSLRAATLSVRQEFDNLQTENQKLKERLQELERLDLDKQKLVVCVSLVSILLTLAVTILQG